MFIRLNNRAESRKFSPLMCKTLATVSLFPRSLLAPSQGFSYLLESMGLRIAVLESIGL
jgi:hypothetical protein